MTLDDAYLPLHAWLTDTALPLWAERGLDRRDGGFFEKIDHAGNPTDDPRRTRLVARQVFSFAAAHEMGWTGPGLEIAAHGVDYLLDRCIAPDGLVHSVLAPDGTVLKGEFDSYDHAFALFSLATASSAGIRPQDCRNAAEVMLTRMKADYAHPEAGFFEGMPPGLLLLANPHMHLFEAALEWLEVTGEESAWRTFAAELAGLALRRLVDPESGAIRETWDLEWQAVPDGDRGHVIEPGHQFEWAWLLLRWGRLSGNDAAIDAGKRLIEIGERHGIDNEGLCFNAIDPGFAATDTDRRLWPQTERIKANLAVGNETGAAEALNGLARYFDTPVPGLWFETLRPDGTPVDEPARGSSLYHITCALREVARYRSRRP